MLQLKGWIGIKNHPIEVEDLVLGLEEYKTLTHSQQQPQGPKLTKRSLQSD